MQSAETASPHPRLSEETRFTLGTLSFRGLFATDSTATATWDSAVDLEYFESALPDALFIQNQPVVDDATETRDEQNRFDAKSAESSHLQTVIHEPVAQRKRMAVPLGLQEPGTIIGKFRIDELLGSGAFAVVYRATHLLLRMPVAIKLLKPELLYNDPGLADLLCEEARFTAQLNHPNIVRIFDIVRNEDLTYLVMEFIEGDSLAALLERHDRLPITQVVEIGMDVCAGLRSAFRKGLIHRDIKPANILVCRNGTAKIVDLGLAQRLNDGNLNGELANSIVGTPIYMPPEQSLYPEKVDFRSDIYSLGVTLYHAVTGMPPFIARDLAELTMLHRSAPVPHPQLMAPECPARFSNLILKMLEKAPEDRPADYDMLWKEFRALHALYSPNAGSLYTSRAAVMSAGRPI